MREVVFFIIVAIFMACNSTSRQSDKTDQNNQSKIIKNETYKEVARLPEILKEVSGIVKDGDFIWTISDDPAIPICKLDLSGKLIQKVQLKDITLTDVEDITVDDEFLYVADIGDNNGTGRERKIIRIKKDDIPASAIATVKADEIYFSFPPQAIANKEQNKYDCEALFNYGNHLYAFTKRRNDEQTELYELPKKPGRHIPKLLTFFNSEGLVTAASFNRNTNTLALAGYRKKHQAPFIWLINGKDLPDFFSGSHQKYVLTSQPIEWQVESVTFKDDETLLFACEKTKDVPAVLYSMNISSFH